MVLFEGPDRVIALVEYSLYHLCRSKKERERKRIDQMDPSESQVLKA
jgi:hypothetical protein